MSRPKKMELNDNPFTGLEESLGIPEGSAVVVKTEQRPFSINGDTPYRNEMNDEEFVANGLKGLIVDTQDILDRLSDEIKSGTDARTFEVYGQLLDTATRQFTELRQLREASMKGRLKNKEIIVKKKQLTKLSDMKKTEKITMSSSELYNLIQKASDNSEIKRIDAHFKVTKVDGDEEPNNI